MYLYLIQVGQTYKYGVTIDLDRRLNEHARTGKVTLLDTVEYFNIITGYKDERRIRKEFASEWVPLEKKEELFSLFSEVKKNRLRI